MAYEIITETVAEQQIVAVRRRVRVGEVGAAWKPALDQVWAFLRGHPGVWTDGRNLFLYHHPSEREQPMDVNFGVEIAGNAAGAQASGAADDGGAADGQVTFTHTPAGEVARTVHVGSPDTLGAAHDAIHAWARAHGRTIGSASWEVYGHWTDEPEKFEIRVVYLLAAKE